MCKTFISSVIRRLYVVQLFPVGDKTVTNADKVRPYELKWHLPGGKPLIRTGKKTSPNIKECGWCETVDDVWGAMRQNSESQRRAGTTVLVPSRAWPHYKQPQFSWEREREERECLRSLAGKPSRQQQMLHPHTQAPPAECVITS